MIPIICENVVSGSTIHTDEIRSYGILTSKRFVHGMVCHKYIFINPVTGVHTQSVGSINNLIRVILNQSLSFKHMTERIF